MGGLQGLKGCGFQASGFTMCLVWVFRVSRVWDFWGWMQDAEMCLGPLRGVVEGVGVYPGVRSLRIVVYGFVSMGPPIRDTRFMGPTEHRGV